MLPLQNRFQNLDFRFQSLLDDHKAGNNNGIQSVYYINCYFDKWRQNRNFKVYEAERV